MAPVGSHWYYAGDHWVVTASTTQDGEPAVRLRKRKSQRPRWEPIVITRLLARHGTRTEATA